MMQIKDRVTGFWVTIPEPRGASVWQSVTYLAIGLGGVMGALYPPASVTTQVSPWMMTYWAFLLAAGGLAGAIAVLPGIFWLERFAIVATGFGFAIYIAALWGAYTAGGLQHSNSAWPIGMFVAALLANMGTRWSRVRHGARDPERFSRYTRPAAL